MQYSSIQNTIKFIIQQTVEVIKRFPLSLCCSLLFCILSITDIQNIQNKTTYLTILFDGCFWFLSLKLYIESKKLSLIRYYLIGIPIFMIIASCLWNSRLIEYQSLEAGFFLSICIAPFIKMGVSNINIWQFNYALWKHIGLTILATIILMISICLIISSVDFLFAVKFYDKIYSDALIIIGSGFAPVMAMSGIPKRYDIIKEELPEVVCMTITYIILPLLFLYTIILYTYAAKILVQWNLPRGEITYIVTCFGIIGIIIYIATATSNKIFNLIIFFNRNFFRVFIVPIILLIIGLGIRIYKYGITEARCIVFLCVVWFILSTAIILIKKQQALQVILISLVLLLISNSILAIKVSEWSQVRRLEIALQKNHILLDGKIHKLSKDVESTEINNIISIVNYLVYTNKIGQLKLWFDIEPYIKRNTQSNIKNPYIKNHNISKRIFTDIGIDKAELKKN